jgi:hypothetical protein
MQNQNFTSTLTVDQIPAEFFDAINNIWGWWTGEIDGDADEVSDEFSYRCQRTLHSKQKVLELVTGEKVFWHLVDPPRRPVKPNSLCHGKRSPPELLSHRDSPNRCSSGHLSLTEEQRPMAAVASSKSRTSVKHVPNLCRGCPEAVSTRMCRTSTGSQWAARVSIPAPWD